MDTVELCKCGKPPRFWRFGDVYICGCRQSKLQNYISGKIIEVESGCD